MSEVVEFRPAQAVAEERVCETLTQMFISEFGDVAGYRVGHSARYGGLPPGVSALLLRVACEIERRQGFGWWFPDEAEVERTGA